MAVVSISIECCSWLHLSALHAELDPAQNAGRLNLVVNASSSIVAACAAARELGNAWLARDLYQAKGDHSRLDIQALLNAERTS